MNSRAYVARYNFNGSDQNKKVGVLSGGERNRLHLAMTLQNEANVLLLMSQQMIWMLIHYEH